MSGDIKLSERGHLLAEIRHFVILPQQNQMAKNTEIRNQERKVDLPVGLVQTRISQIFMKTERTNIITD